MGKNKKEKKKYPIKAVVVMVIDIRLAEIARVCIVVLDHIPLRHSSRNWSCLLREDHTTWRLVRGTVNPEYFVCMLFSYISYAAASV